MVFVYVLISKEDDYYTEETLMSMYSLKESNPASRIVCLLDQATFDSLKGERSRVLQYINETIIVNPPEGFNPVQRSRFLKTSLREHITGNLLYLDNDTVITGDLTELENEDFEIGAVLNQHRDDWSRTTRHEMLKIYYNETGMDPDSELNLTGYFNGGVIFSRDTENTHAFFRKWHELWLKSSTLYNFHKDQPDMWRANFLTGNKIKAIPGIYNCQLIYPKTSLIYIPKAKILHYFSSSCLSPYIKLKDRELLESVRKNGIHPDLKNYLKDIKEGYLYNIMKYLSEESVINAQPMVIFGRKIARDLPVSNSIARRLYKLFGYKI